MKNEESGIKKETSTESKDKRRNVSLVTFFNDFIEDMRDERKLFQRIFRWLSITILLLIVVVFGISIWNQKMMMDLASTTTDKFIKFLNEFEFYSEVELLTDNNSENFGSINIGK